MHIDWNHTSEKEKKMLKSKRWIMFMGSREISQERITQIQRKLVGKDVIWGVLKDEYIPGLEGAAQFKTLRKDDLAYAVGDELTLSYYQRDWKYILREVNLSSAILVHGSWSGMLHQRQEYWQLEKRAVKIKLISGFTGVEEARAYENKIAKEFNYNFSSRNKNSEEKIFSQIEKIKLQSYDYGWQIGAVLVKKGEVLTEGYNMVVPEQWHILHFGSVREKKFAPSQDQNYYDTIHAEMQILANCAREGVKTQEASLYINTMPCPACARSLTQSGIKEVFYKHDHSDGYGAAMLESSGVTCKRVV